MTVTLSIKNVPEELAQRLKDRAARNHRSLQGELMAILEYALPFRLPVRGSMKSMLTFKRPVSERRAMKRPKWCDRIVMIRVVDVSAVAAMLFGEPDAPWVHACCLVHPLIVPGIFHFELGNTCRMKCDDTRMKPRHYWPTGWTGIPNHR